jgi:hypothetical protein
MRVQEKDRRGLVHAGLFAYHLSPKKSQLVAKEADPWKLVTYQ